MQCNVIIIGLQVLHFTTTVRCKETRQITVHNKTAVPWVLCPIINGVHWTGPVSFAVPAGGASHYELTYHPLVMTHDSQKHSVSSTYSELNMYHLRYSIVNVHVRTVHTCTSISTLL